ncbi:hypothetical protein [Mesorhizobium sp.]|uniref:hypothetical protein n=1 Tax=Mesorhizobium sp. TaxID=1871066 RepID=UPI0025F4D93C|nr:hypothetical protein [Mesorhizobium sp.]
MTYLSFGVSGGATSAGTFALNKLLDARVTRARDILIEELKLGSKQSADIAPEDAAAVTMRYMRAAIEGTARLNLRLLAAVAAGQPASPSFYPDEFLAIADSLASLRREEVILLGVIQRQARKFDFKIPNDGNFWLACLAILHNEHGISRDDADGYAASCLRSGFVTNLGGLYGMGHAYMPSARMKSFDKIMDVEGVMQRHTRAEPSAGS